MSFPAASKGRGLQSHSLFSCGKAGSSPPRIFADIGDIAQVDAIMAVLDVTAIPFHAIGRLAFQRNSPTRSAAQRSCPGNADRCFYRHAIGIKKNARTEDLRVEPVEILTAAPAA